jgi:hypothetical protein
MKKKNQQTQEYKTTYSVVEGRVCLVTVVPQMKQSKFLCDNTRRYTVVINGRAEFALSA